jgi:hypothetical protein
MQAEITKFYRIAPEGHTTLTFQKGDVVSGKVAERAIADGCAVEIGKPKLEAPKPAELETPKEPAIEEPDLLPLETPTPKPVSRKAKGKKA